MSLSEATGLVLTPGVNAYLLSCLGESRNISDLSMSLSPKTILVPLSRISCSTIGTGF